MISTIARIFRTNPCSAYLAPYKAPIEPPIIIAETNNASIDQSKSNCELIPMPTKPDSEFTKINTAAVAAAVLTLAHLFSRSIV